MLLLRYWKDYTMILPSRLKLMPYGITHFEASGAHVVKELKMHPIFRKHDLFLGKAGEDLCIGVEDGKAATSKTGAVFIQWRWGEAWQD